MFSLANPSASSRFSRYLERTRSEAGQVASAAGGEDGERSFTAHGASRRVSFLPAGAIDSDFSSEAGGHANIRLRVPFDSGPEKDSICAARTVAGASDRLNWARPSRQDHRDRRPAAPLRSVEQPERMLSEREIAAIWTASELETPFHAVIRMMVLTGRGWREVVGLTWAELSPALTSWTIPSGRSSDGEMRVVPLCWRAVSVLGMIRRDPGNRYVFADRRGRLKGFAEAKAALDDRSGVRGWRVEDLTSAVARSLARLVASGGQVADLDRSVGASAPGATKSSVAFKTACESHKILCAWAEHVASISANASSARSAFQQAGKRLLRRTLEPVAVLLS